MGIALTFGPSCVRTPTPPPSNPVTTLRLGAALPAGTPGSGLSGLTDLLYSEPLLAVDRSGRAQGRLAESWQASADGREIRVTLRTGVKFHDGRLLTSAIARDILRNGLKGQQNVESVNAEGNDVVIRLQQPDIFLPTDLNQYPILIPGKPTVGTGPFKLVREGDRPVLEAFKEYHRGVPTIDRVELARYSNLRAAWAAMMRGQADMLHEVSRDSVEFVNEQSQVRTYSTLRPYYIALVFNLRHPALREREVRQALNEAIDREALIRTAMRGLGQPADGPIWPYHWAYTSVPQSVSHNAVAAKLRLDAAGLPESTVKSTALMPSRLRFRCMYYAQDARFERLALVVQKQLSEIGVDVEMEPVGHAEFGRRAVASEFDAFLSELNSGRSLSWVYHFWHSPVPGEPRLLDTGYRSADAALDRIRRSTSDDETRAAVAEVQRELTDDPPAVFLVWPQVTRAVDMHFNVAESDTGDILGTIWQWRRRPEAVVASR